MQQIKRSGLLVALFLSGCAVTTPNNERISEAVTTKADAIIAAQPSGRTQKYSKFVDVPYVGTRVADAPPSRNIPAVLTGKVPVARLAAAQQAILFRLAESARQDSGLDVDEGSAVGRMQAG